MGIDSESKVVTLSVRDVLRIVRACKVNGVRELKLGELSLVLDTPEKGIEETIPSAAIPRGKRKVEEAQSRETQMKLDFVEEQDQVALMLIEDPLEMEKRIASGDLIDEVLES